MSGKKVLRKKKAGAAVTDPCGGRPSKLPKVDLEQVTALASLGLTEEEIALVLKVERKTLYNWKQSDEKFLLAIKEGKAKADAQVLQSLYNKATGRRVITRPTRGGPVEAVVRTDPETLACIFWLKNRRPKEWQDRQRVDGNLNVIGKMSMAQLKKSIKVIERADARA